MHIDKTRKITLCAVLSALAIALSIFERLIPLELIIPVPGVKLGLANVVTLFAFIKLSPKYAAIILFIRTSLTALLIGSITSFLMSITGGIFAFLAYLCLKPFFEKYVSVYGMSIAGAAFHNIGQIMMAMILLSTFTVLSYLPFLLIISIFSGFLTGQVAKFTLKYDMKNK